MADAQLTGYPIASRFITVNCQSGSPVSWTVDRDCNLLTLYSWQGLAVVSNDPNLTYAQFVNPTADGVSDGFAIAYLWEPSFIPLTKGSKIYVAPQAAPAVIQLFFDV